MSTPQQPSSGPLHSEFATDPEVADLVKVFIDEMPDRVAALRTVWEQQQLEELRRLAHQLKGAGAGYGFAPIGEAASRLESTVEALAGGASEATTLQLRQRFDELVRLCGRAAL